MKENLDGYFDGGKSQEIISEKPIKNLTTLDSELSEELEPVLSLLPIKTQTIEQETQEE